MVFLYGAKPIALRYKALMNQPLRPPSINHTPLPGVGRIIAIASGKGGVGKSTVTVNLAHALTARGLRVGILDADIYGPSIPRMLGLDTYVKPEIADGMMVPPIAHGIRAMSMALVTGDQAAVLRAPMITKALVQFLRTELPA
jgi:ATP-binding protein involved in chromosome partitioning